MKKILILTSLLALGLTGCTPFEPGPVIEGYTEPTTLEEIYKRILDNRVLEGKETETTTHTSTLKRYYNTADRVDTTSEELTMYKSGYSVTKSTVDTKWENIKASGSSSSYDPSKVETEIYRGLVSGDTKNFYNVRDVKGSKDNDSIQKLAIVDYETTDNNEIFKDEVPYNTSMFASYYVLNIIDTPFEMKYGEDYEVSKKSLNDDITEYSASIKDYSLTDDDYGAIVMDYDLTIRLDKKDGFLHGFDYSYTQRDANDVNEVTQSFTETYTVNRGSYKADTSDHIDPLSFFLTDYEVELWKPNSATLGKKDIVDANDVPIGATISARTKNEVPANALGEDLVILSSSNTAVGTVSNGTFTGLTTGVTDLVVKSNILNKNKVISIKVTRPLPETATIRFASAADVIDGIAVGDKYPLYTAISPVGADQSLKVESLDTSVATITQESGTYYFNAVKEGEVTIKVSSTINSSISSELSVKVYTNNPDMATVLSSLEWYHLYSANWTLSFKADGTGESKYLLEEGTTNFDTDAFTWTASGRVATLSDIEIAGFTYKNIKFRLKKSLDWGYFSYDGYTTDEEGLRFPSRAKA